MNSPLVVETRPFAIEPVTSVMLPDGIFDNAIYNLIIACHFTNTSSADLTGVSLYLESIGDPGITVAPQTYAFARIRAGASVLVKWNANFQAASPGKPLVSFISKADGFTSKRSIQQIFVSQTRYDDVTKKWVLTVPEGRLEVTNLYAIKPGNTWSACTDKGDNCRPWLAPHLPTGIKMAWYPNPAFAGQHGDLPFSDPWWKVLAIIVAIVAAIVGLIAAAYGAGTFEPGVKGSYDDDPGHPSVQCCTPKPGGGFKNNATTVAGVCSTICSVAIAVACSDAADPIWRGQENTAPQPGELTVSEHVDAHWDFLDDPNAGTPYRTHVKWQYERVTTGDTYFYAVDEEQANIHVVDHVTFETPATVHVFNPLWVHATFTKPDKSKFAGADLYAFALFESPGGQAFVEPLVDDGIGLDKVASDGIYTASLDLERAYREILQFGGDQIAGIWKVYVYAQDVNRTKPGTPPVIAAQTIGGFFVSSAISITFDPTLPCPLKAQGIINVV